MVENPQFIPGAGEIQIDTDDEWSPSSIEDEESDTDESVPNVISTTMTTRSSNNQNNPGTSSSQQENDERNLPNEDDEEDETIRAIIAAIKKQRSHPPEIKLEDFVTDISFHPENDIIALASITGDVLLYKYTNEANTLLKTLEVHTKACRDVEWSDDGKFILTASKDKSIMITDIETEKLKNFYDDAHNTAIYKLYVIDENLFATGKLQYFLDI